MGSCREYEKVKIVRAHVFLIHKNTLRVGISREHFTHLNFGYHGRLLTVDNLLWIPKPIVYAIALPLNPYREPPTGRL